MKRGLIIGGVIVCVGLGLLVLAKRVTSLPDMKFSSAATEVTDPSTFVAGLGGSLTTAHDNKPAALVVYQLPDVWLPSGRVLAADGLILDGKPFTRKVNPGRYPLLLGVAKLGDDERVAFAMLRFSEERVTRWEMALTEGQDLAKLAKGEIFGYGVDSGTGCFCDPSVQKMIEDSTSIQLKFPLRVITEMKKANKPTRDWVHIETSGGSAALFSSGFGDGAYASYFGMDEEGKVVALVTDFAIVNWPGRP